MKVIFYINNYIFIIAMLFDKLKKRKIKNYVELRKKTLGNIGSGYYRDWLSKSL